MCAAVAVTKNRTREAMLSLARVLPNYESRTEYKAAREGSEFANMRMSSCSTMDYGGCISVQLASSLRTWMNM